MPLAKLRLFCICYFWRMKRKPTKKITEPCFSCQNKSVCQKLAQSYKKWKSAKNRYMPFLHEGLQLDQQVSGIYNHFWCGLLEMKADYQARGWVFDSCRQQNHNKIIFICNFFDDMGVRTKCLRGGGLKWDSAWRQGRVMDWVGMWGLLLIAKTKFTTFHFKTIH